MNKVTVRRSQYEMLNGYVNTYRGPQPAKVYGWYVDTAHGTFGPVAGKKYAERLAVVARQGINIVGLEPSFLFSLYMTYSYGTERHPGKNGAMWKTVKAFILSSTDTKNLADEVHKLMRADHEAGR